MLRAALLFLLIGVVACHDLSAIPPAVENNKEGDGSSDSSAGGGGADAGDAFGEGRDTDGGAGDVDVANDARSFEVADGDGPVVCPVDCADGGSDASRPECTPTSTTLLGHVRRYESPDPASFRGATTVSISNPLSVDNMPLSSHLENPTCLARRHWSRRFRNARGRADPEHHPDTDLDQTPELRRQAA
jgi:hypothetical protein